MRYLLLSLLLASMAGCEPAPATVKPAEPKTTDQPAGTTTGGGATPPITGPANAPAESK